MDHIAALEAWKSIIGATYEIEPMPRVTNPLWRVVAEGGRAYVLRRLPEFAPGAGPVDAYRVISHLLAAGVPVVPPIISDNGRIHEPAGDRNYELVPFVESDPGPHTAETAYAVGQAIARFDRALADCPWPVSSYVDDPAKDILGEALPKLSAEITERVAPLADRLRTATEGLPVQRTHGDCNTGNVLVHNGEVSGFIDIDHLPIGPRVRDLSYYLASRLREQPQPVLAVLGSYVAGYHDTCPLSERELTAVAPLILLMEIGLAGWAQWGWNPNPAVYRQCLRSIEWITANFGEIAAAATS